MKNKNRQGISLFEITVAVALVSIVLISLTSLAVKTVGNTNYSKYQSLSARYTQEAMEWLRNERDLGWAQFVARASSSGNTICIRSLSWSSGCGNIAGTSLERRVTLTYNPGVNRNEVTVAVFTSWNDATGYHESRATTIFTNWKGG